MYQFLLPLAIAAAALPCHAQTISMQAPPTGETPAGLTLEQALSRTYRANPSLAGAQHELQAVDGMLLQAHMRPNPSLELGVQDTRKESRESTLQLSQPIELGGKRGYRIKAAEKGRDVASLDLQIKRLEIRSEVRKAFCDVLLGQQRLSLAADSLVNAQRASAAAEKRVTTGKISPVEASKARVAEAGVRLELLQAKSELATARNRLATYWGLHGERNGAASFEAALGTLEDMPTVPSLAQLGRKLAASPMLAKAQIEIERRQALSDLERSKRVPDVSLSLGIKRSEELGRNQALLGLSVPLPLFDRNQGNLLESLRRTDKARDELAAATLNLNSELAQTYAKLAAARDEASTLRSEIMPGAKQAFDAASTGFEFGKFSFLDVLDAQRTLLQTKSQYLRALGDVHRAAADIERLTGDAHQMTIQ